jgi:hypothetical protein
MAESTKTSQAMSAFASAWAAASIVVNVPFNAHLPKRV